MESLAPLKKHPRADVKLPAERKLGGTIEKPLGALHKASRRTDTGDKIAGATG